MSTEAMNEIVAVDDSTATIVPNQQEQFDLVDVEGAAAFMKNYQDAIKALLTPEDYQTIANKDFKKKSAWRKLATAFRISDEIVNEQLEYDDTNQIVRARYRVRCTLPNGRSAEGVGVCSIYDKIRYKATQKFAADTETPSNFELRGRFSNAEHDVPSTAHSRAKNRAISDLIGAGEVSAEEMTSTHQGKKPGKPGKPGKPKTPKTRMETEPVPVVTNSTFSNKPKKAKAPKMPKTKKERAEEHRMTGEDKTVEVDYEVHDMSSDKSSMTLKELIDSDKNIRLAVDELQAQEATVNRDTIKAKLLDLNEMGKVTTAEYEQCKKLLE